MTSPVLTLSSDSIVSDAWTIMAHKEFRHTPITSPSERIHAMPILDGTSRLVGILSARDILRAIANHGPLELWT